MAMTELATQFGGINFKNPFLVAACPSTRDADHILEASRCGWAGAVMKTVSAHPPFEKNPTPSLAALRSRRNELIGMSSNEIYTDIRLNRWCAEEIPKIKRLAAKDFVLIGSVMEGPEPEHWSNTARRLERAGIDMLEMNVSCPHGMSERYMGRYIQDDPDLLCAIVNACAGSVNIPVVVKLNAQTLDAARLVKACGEGGASGISATNTVACVISVDLDTLRPNPASEGFSTFAGYCGPALRPIALRFVAELASASQIGISGVGGIENWRNAIEFVLFGASTVQIATAVMLKGYSMVTDLLAGVEDYLMRRGHSRISELRGKSLQYLVSSTEIESISTNGIALVNEAKCTRCDECIDPCRAGATNAIRIEKEKLVVDSELCIGCGLCILVCRFGALQVGHTRST